jgi:hypothetical protein
MDQTNQRTRGSDALLVALAASADWPDSCGEESCRSWGLALPGAWRIQLALAFGTTCLPPCFPTLSRCVLDMFTAKLCY